MRQLSSDSLLSFFTERFFTRAASRTVAGITLESIAGVVLILIALDLIFTFLLVGGTAIGKRSYEDNSWSSWFGLSRMSGVMRNMYNRYPAHPSSATVSVLLPWMRSCMMHDGDLSPESRPPMTKTRTPSDNNWIYVFRYLLDAWRLEGLATQPLIMSHLSSDSVLSPLFRRFERTLAPVARTLPGIDLSTVFLVLLALIAVDFVGTIFLAMTVGGAGRRSYEDNSWSSWLGLSGMTSAVRRMYNR